MYTVIQSSKEQADALYEKHMKPVEFKRFLGNIKITEKILSKSFSYDDEDSIGFVTLKTITGKTISYQFRRETPCFVEFTGFGNIRYDISYPEQLNLEMYKMLKKLGIEVRDAFWKGGQI